MLMVLKHWISRMILRFIIHLRQLPLILIQQQLLLLILVPIALLHLLLALVVMGQQVRMPPQFTVLMVFLVQLVIIPVYML